MPSLGLAAGFGCDGVPVFLLKRPSPRAQAFHERARPTTTVLPLQACIANPQLTPPKLGGSFVRSRMVLASYDSNKLLTLRQQTSWHQLRDDDRRRPNSGRLASANFGASTTDLATAHSEGGGGRFGGGFGRICRGRPDLFVLSGSTTHSVRVGHGGSRPRRESAKLTRRNRPDLAHHGADAVRHHRSEPALGEPLARAPGDGGRPARLTQIEPMAKNRGH